MDTDTPTLQDRLLKATVGSCGCDTKTPELIHHDLQCHYRLFTEAFDVIRQLPPEQMKRLYRLE